MGGTWTSDRLPQFEPALRRLTGQHRDLEGEPLHLALAYLPRREGEDVHDGIYLFEVIGGLADRVSVSGELFETTFEVVSGLPTGFGQPLHLILTTARELEVALETGELLARELADAVCRGDYKVLHADAVGRRVVKRLSPPVSARKRVTRE